MNGPRADDNDRPEAVLLPTVALWVEVERVAPRLGIVVLVSYATLAPQNFKLGVRVAANPLSEGEIRAVAAAIKVARDQDALEPEREEVEVSSVRPFLSKHLN